MKTKNLLLWGLAALGGYALWKKVGVTGLAGTFPKLDPLYAEYSVWLDNMHKQNGLGKYAVPGQATPMIYIMDFAEWKKAKGYGTASISNVAAKVESSMPTPGGASKDSGMESDQMLQDLQQQGISVGTTKAMANTQAAAAIAQSLPLHKVEQGISVGTTKAMANAQAAAAIAQSLPLRKVEQVLQNGTIAAIAQSLPLRKVEQVLQNGTIVAGMSEVLPPAPMEMAWQYPGLQSAHAPGRIYKV